MTRSQTHGDGIGASGVSGGVRVPPVVCECGRSQRTREQWTLTGRQIHWGYTFLVWTRDDGKRFARWVK